MVPFRIPIIIRHLILRVPNVNRNFATAFQQIHSTAGSLSGSRPIVPKTTKSLEKAGLDKFFQPLFSNKSMVLKDLRLQAYISQNQQPVGKRLPANFFLPFPIKKSWRKVGMRRIHGFEGSHPLGLHLPKPSFRRKKLAFATFSNKFIGFEGSQALGLHVPKPSFRWKKLACQTLSNVFLVGNRRKSWPGQLFPTNSLVLKDLRLQAYSF